MLPKEYTKNSSFLLHHTSIGNDLHRVDYLEEYPYFLINDIFLTDDQYWDQSNNNYS